MADGGARLIIAPEVAQLEVRATYLVAELDAKAPKTELVLNEFIPVVQVRSCQPGGGSDAAVAPCLLVHVGSPLLPAEHESTTGLC